MSDQQSSNLEKNLDLRPLGDTLLTEPEVDFLLGVLDAVYNTWSALPDRDDKFRKTYVSEPWQTFRPTARAKSPRMVPGADCKGLVAPKMDRPVLTASKPSQTIPTTGPEFMYLMSPGKKAFSFKSS